MTRLRATDPSPRTVALHRVTQTAVSLLLALLVVACGTSGSPASGAPRVPASPTVGPSIASSPGATSAITSSPVVAAGSGVPDPSQPTWPGTTVLAVIALGAADGEIQKAGVDLTNAAAAHDLPGLRGAADGLATMIDGLMPNLDRLDVYPGTQAVAALYRKAFPELAAGAKQLRDSITSGDAPGVAAGSRLLSQGVADYGPIREQIGAHVEQAIVQQRLLLQ